MELLLIAGILAAVGYWAYKSGKLVVNWLAASYMYVVSTFGRFSTRMLV